ncbi:phage tail tape measure protein [Bacillus tropicus]|uniref:Phage tail tape measure protein n=1 Tax=Bacillus tropicus TaxID=2026188 RepID=A0A7T2V4N9_9BACI|nr:phage tail tape measure protein [Bacillus tropicus]AJG91984.1 phage tail tape measure protein, TP901 family, core region [Bacillus cereus]QPR75989.1 phage tail tape measure protein [Bacillus tropicus]
MSANAGEVRAKLTLDNTQFQQRMKEAQEQMKDTEKTSKKTSDTMKNTSNSMTALGTASAAAGLAMVASIGATVKSAANFEQSMAKVKAISGATDTEFAALSATAKEMGATTQYSASQAADGLAFLSLAGFKAQDSIDAIPSVLNLAAAGALDLGTAADIASNIMTGFGLSAKDTGFATDVLAKTFTTANTDMNQLGMAMKYVAPVANALGWDITDAATAVAKMSDAGIQGSQAGTSLRAALLSLANPTGQTEKAFEKLGISVTDANGQFKPLPELIGHISSKMEGMTETQKTVTAAQLVGTEASAGFLALLAQGQPALENYKKSLEESGGTAERVAKTMQDTLLGAWTQTKSAAEGLAINLGQALLPAFTSVAHGAATLIGSLAQLDPAFLAGGLAAAAFASGAILVANNMSKVIGAVRLLSATLLTNPATAWIAGVSLAVGALTTVLMKASGSTREYKEVSLDTYKSLGEQADSMNNLANRYDELKGKIKLSTDELLRYKDLQNEIAKAEDGASKDAMIAEYEKLGKQAGVTKEEMDEYLQVNADIIAKAPATVTAFDNKGNAIVKTSDEARKLADSYKEMQRIELELQQTQLMINQKKDLEDMVEASKNYQESLKERGALEKAQAEAQSRYDSMRKQHQDAINRGDEKGIENTAKLLDNRRNTLMNANAELAANKAAGTELRGHLNSAQQKLQMSERTTDLIVQEQLAAVGVQAATKDAVSAIQEKLNAEQNVVRELEAQKDAAGGLTDEQQKTLDAASKNVDKLNEAKDAINNAKSNQDMYKQGFEDTLEVIEDMNDGLEKPVDKEVKTNTDEEIQKADELNEKAGKDVTKKVKGDNSHANNEIDKTDAKGQKENTKKLKGDNSHANNEIDKTNTKAKEENTKKLKGDNSHANSEIDKTNTKAKEENTKKLKGDNSDANSKIEDTNNKGKEEVTKPLQMDASQAKEELDKVKREAQKSERKSVYVDIYESVKRTVTSIFGGSEKRHNGGTLGNIVGRPKYHNGGTPRGQRQPNQAKFDEVDVRLRDDEMVLTQAQQKNLFNMVRTFNTATAAQLAKVNEGGGSGGRQIVNNFNIAELHVREEADVEKVAKELKTMERTKDRARGI